MDHEKIPLYRKKNTDLKFNPEQPKTEPN